MGTTMGARQSCSANEAYMQAVMDKTYADIHRANGPTTPATLMNRTYANIQCANGPVPPALSVSAPIAQTIAYGQPVSGQSGAPSSTYKHDVTSPTAYTQAHSLAHAAPIFVAAPPPPTSRHEDPCRVTAPTVYNPRSMVATEYRHQGQCAVPSAPVVYCHDSSAPIARPSIGVQH